MDKNVHIPASEVVVGDNVWEHNIVTSIKVVRNHRTEEKFLLFNGETITPWIADGSTTVMVTNR